MRIFRVHAMILIAIMALTLSACNRRRSSRESNPSAPTRSFHMGFTNWPYAATTAAVDDTWSKIHAHGDMITIHLDQGVPWPEAYAGTAYPASVEAELKNYTDHIAPDKTVFLSVACLDNFRQNLAGYWSDAGGNQPRPDVWAARSFADAEVATAYVNWMSDLVARFKPAYVNYAVEVSELAWQDPAEFTGYPVFAQRVYTALKAMHPSLPLFCSVALKSPGSLEMATVAAAYGSIRDWNDVMGVSVYAYAFFSHPFSGNPASLPADWLSQAEAMAPGKPIAIAETGWIAETLDIPLFGIHVDATPAHQEAFVALLLAEADAKNALFVSWFCIVDFDTLWTDSLGSSPVAQVWKDTGLYDGSVTARPSLTTWESWRALARR